MQYLYFAVEHPWTALGAVALLFIAFGFLLDAIVSIISQILRSRNIRASGWPPQHLDASGDPIDGIDQLMSRLPIRGTTPPPSGED